MKKSWLIMLAVLVCATGLAFAGQISPADMAGKPSGYCKVVKGKEPNPALLGHFSCVHRTRNDRASEYVMEPIEYWLVKSGDQYALYFYRVKDGKTVYRGWRKWYLDGDRINSGESAEISVKDGEVYYRWKLDTPTKMTRIE